MKILFITDKSIAGGATVALLNMVRELKKNTKFELTIITVLEDELNSQLNSMEIYNFADNHVEAMQEISKGRLPIFFFFL